PIFSRRTGASGGPRYRRSPGTTRRAAVPARSERAPSHRRIWSIGAQYRVRDRRHRLLGATHARRRRSEKITGAVADLRSAKCASENDGGTAQQPPVRIAERKFRGFNELVGRSERI